MCKFFTAYSINSSFSCENYLAQRMLNKIINSMKSLQVEIFRYISFLFTIEKQYNFYSQKTIYKVIIVITISL